MRKSKVYGVLADHIEAEAKKLSLQEKLPGPDAEIKIREYAVLLADLSGNVITGKDTKADALHMKAWLENRKAEEALLFRKAVVNVISQVTLKLAKEILSQIKIVL